MIYGIDCASKLTAQAAAEIKAAGYEFAGRYLVPPVGLTKWKALSKDECRAVTGAGLRLLTVWETTADRVRGGMAAGAEDGARAVKLAEEYGIPDGAAVYFAVDYDARADDYGTIESYLFGARAQLGGRWRVGVYGSFRVIEEMAKRCAADCFWQCVAWSGGMKSGHRHVFQAKFGQRAAGVMVDINECEDMKKAGIWSYADKFDEEDEDMDINRFRELWLEMRKELQDNDASDWSEEGRSWCVKSGIVQGGSSGEFNGMWQDVLTREQMAVMLYRFAKLIGRA